MDPDAFLKHKNTRPPSASGVSHVLNGLTTDFLLMCIRITRKTKHPKVDEQIHWSEDNKSHKLFLVVYHVSVKTAKGDRHTDTSILAQISGIIQLAPVTWIQWSREPVS